jgi:hypothetical protein
MQKEVKLLLLGAGASGKSTVLKQMRLINNLPWSAEEREDFRRITFSNIVGGCCLTLSQSQGELMGCIISILLLMSDRHFITCVSVTPVSNSP